MTEFGYFLSSEEFTPAELIEQARQAEEAGFTRLAFEVRAEMLAEAGGCGDDPEDHRALLRSYVDAGSDELYAGQIGGGHREFFAFCRDRVLPALAA